MTASITDDKTTRLLIIAVLVKRLGDSVQITQEDILEFELIERKIDQ